MTHEMSFGRLAKELSIRAARATMSQLSPRNQILREVLGKGLEEGFSSEAGFLAPPVLESLFEWESQGARLEEVDFLHRSLIEAMDEPPEALGDCRFGKDWYPHRHQMEAWRLLEGGKSVIVSSGTASGKTECFLVPILNSLYKEFASTSQQLEGVRALFLYPLNALINSQRNRLDAWTAGSKGGVRFALYNGATPDEAPVSEGATSPSWVRDRKSLRSSPPPILVTNSTILEYMLVRSIDRPILEKSQGTLKWIVLDEAHTYLGSGAAEVSLLLRRVMAGFGADPSEVRFVATSATMGSADDAHKLKTFLADLAGVATDQVEVVIGRRTLPDLPEHYRHEDETLPGLPELREMDPPTRFDCLAKSGAMRELRTMVAEKPRTVLEIDAKIAETSTSAETLELLELATETEGASGSSFLPLRAHFFQRTTSGIWCCLNPRCEERKEQGLDQQDWKRGRLWFERRYRCDCGGLVFELVFCGHCGSDYMPVLDDGRRLSACHWDSPDLDAEDFFGEEEESAEEAGKGRRRHKTRQVIASMDHNDLTSRSLYIDPSSGELCDSKSGSAQFVFLEKEEGEIFVCGVCSGRHTPKRRILRNLRLGSRFYLAAAIPALLSEMPKAEDKPADKPFDGRKLLTFSDSRQGTAYFAARTQIDAERRWAQGLVFHSLCRSRISGSSDREIREIESELGKLQTLVAENPSAAMAVVPLIDGKQAKLAMLRENADNKGILWADLVEDFSQAKDLERMCQAHSFRYRPSALDKVSMARICLLREFYRRPMRQVSIESLGLAAVRHPAIGKIEEVPPTWSLLDQGIESWREFLTLAFELVIRGQMAVRADRSVLRWIGIPAYPTWLVRAEQEDVAAWQGRWPSIVPRRKVPRLAKLLAVGLNLSLEDHQDRETINTLLKESFSALINSKVLVRFDNGYISNPGEFELWLPKKAYVCPVTRRLVASVFFGLTQYQDGRWLEGDLRAQEIEMPQFPYPFGEDQNGNDVSSAVEQWLNEDGRVLHLRDHGLWAEFSDRIVSRPRYYESGEHSAQQSTEILDVLEEKFANGEINLLSCSTTMEMGVDVGGLSAVAMNNAPPGPANFLQRAGRAGRRGQNRAVSLTLCQSGPHGSAVFENPLWPFETPVHVPAVSLTSDKIVQRHVNATVFSHFIAHWGGGSNTLNCGDFFLVRSTAESSVCSEFFGWVESQALKSSGLSEALKRLVKRTNLADWESVALIDEASSVMKAVQETFIQDDDALTAQLETAGGAIADGRRGSAIQRALTFQRKRFLEEYLLRFLACEGFLPSYGFPLHVLQFVTTSIEQIKHHRRDVNQGREDSRARYRSYPSRDLGIAIREFAPGSALVLNGAVYESAGLSMNWKLPPGDFEQRDVQQLSTAKRCKDCGVAWSSSLDEKECRRCSSTSLEYRRYIRPSGFAVDIRSEPHNNLSRRRYVVPKESWIVANADWQFLSNPELGQIRHDAKGKLFRWSSGPTEFGYAICLRCGLAKSELSNRGESPIDRNHTRLRGGRDDDDDKSSICPGGVEKFAVVRNHWLGGQIQTDVVEIRLRNDGGPLTCPSMATSVAVALRDSLANVLGIDSREIGWAVVSDSPESAEQSRFRIALYDLADGGAGYVTSFGDNAKEIFAGAALAMECPKGCDKACHGCLLAWDTQEAWNLLDRHAALQLLRGYDAKAFEVDEKLRIFGEETRVESNNLVATLARLHRDRAIDLLRLYLGGRVGAWSFVDWSALSLVRRLALDGVKIEVVMPRGVVSGMDFDLRGALLRLPPEVELLTGAGQPTIGTSFVVSEVEGTRGSQRWASESLETLIPGETWGRANQSAVVLTAKSKNGLSANDGVPLERQGLMVVDQGWAEQSVTTELDGSITDFGGRFWALLSSMSPELSRKLKDEDDELSSVTYHDRYVRGPLVGRLLFEVLSGLGEMPGGLVGTTELVVVTTGAQAAHAHDKLRHDWPGVSAQKICMRELLGRVVRSPTFDHPRKTWSLPHRRELTLKWRGGEEIIIRLDHGLGFLLPARGVEFDFDVSAKEQIDKLLAMTIDLSGPSAHEVPIYVSPIS